MCILICGIVVGLLVVDNIIYLRQRQYQRALRSGDVAAVIAYLDSGFELNSPIPHSKGAAYPILEAVRSGNPELVHYLLEKGADPSARSQFGIVPLHAAAHLGHIEIVRILLDAGVDINELSPYPGNTALHEAVLMNDPSMVSFLVSQGARIDIRDKGRGMTALEYATSLKRDDIAELLTSASNQNRATHD